MLLLSFRACNLRVEVNLLVISGFNSRKSMRSIVNHDHGLPQFCQTPLFELRCIRNCVVNANFSGFVQCSGTIPQTAQRRTKCTDRKCLQDYEAFDSGYAVDAGRTVSDPRHLETPPRFQEIARRLEWVCREQQSVETCIRIRLILLDFHIVRNGIELVWCFELCCDGRRMH